MGEESILACRMIPRANLWHNIGRYLPGVFGGEKHYPGCQMPHGKEYFVTRPRNSMTLLFGALLK